MREKYAEVTANSYPRSEKELTMLINAVDDNIMHNTEDNTNQNFAMKCSIDTHRLSPPSARDIHADVAKATGEGTRVWKQQKAGSASASDTSSAAIGVASNSQLRRSSRLNK